MCHHLRMLLVIQARPGTMCTVWRRRLCKGLTVRSWGSSWNFPIYHKNWVLVLTMWKAFATLTELFTALSPECWNYGHSISTPSFMQHKALHGFMLARRALTLPTEQSAPGADGLPLLSLSLRFLLGFPCPGTFILYALTWVLTFSIVLHTLLSLLVGSKK